MYDPSVGRWLEEDPIGFDAEDADLYRYVGNNPTDAVDPTGLLAAGPLAGPANLKLKVVVAAKMVMPRTGEMTVNWIPQGVKKGGFVIQHVNVYQEYKNQANGPVIQKTVANYWEAWEVDAKGVVYAGYKKFGIAVKVADKFEWPIPPPNSCGIEEVVGYARYIEGFNVKWPGGILGGGVKWAPTLPSTEQMPAGWTDNGALKHGFGIAWNDFRGVKPFIGITWS